MPVIQSIHQEDVIIVLRIAVQIDIGSLDRNDDDKMKEVVLEVIREIDKNLEKCKEEGGEISCSVEETNRIRAQLGLPPLEIDDTKEEKQVDDDGFVFVDHSKILEEEQIRKKLEKSRQDRERDEYQNLKGKGLGDLLSEEGKELDVKAWV